MAPLHSKAAEAKNDECDDDHHGKLLGFYMVAIALGLRWSRGAKSGAAANCSSWCP
jgi:hypothetical protein